MKFFFNENLVKIFMIYIQPNRFHLFLRKQLLTTHTSDQKLKTIVPFPVKKKLFQFLKNKFDRNINQHKIVTSESSSCCSVSSSSDFRLLFFIWSCDNFIWESSESLSIEVICREIYPIIQ